MKRQNFLNVFLRLGAIVLVLAELGVECRVGLDTRDIAVSDKIVAAKEVTNDGPLLFQNHFTDIFIHMYIQR